MKMYSHSIHWTGNKTWTRVTSNGKPTPKEAKTEAIGMAVRMGWTPPKWWQWWRRHDTRVTIDLDEH